MFSSRDALSYKNSVDQLKEDDSLTRIMDDHVMKGLDRDYVHYIAEENDKDRRAIIRRRVLWQTAIFMIAFLINVLITFREEFVLDKTELTPDSDLRFATNLSQGIGFIVLGNLYDNVPRPKRLTCLILLCLAVCTGLVSSIY